MASPRALLLSGGLGSGHRSLAEGAAAALSAAGWQVGQLDAMAGLGTSAGRLGERAFSAVLSLPPLYDAFHAGVLRGEGSLAARLGALSDRRLVRTLQRCVEADPPDVVLALFPTGVGAAGILRDRGALWRLVALCPDAVAHRLWVHPAVDEYLVNWPSSAAWVERFDPGARVRQVDLPLRPCFDEPPSAPEARKRLGLPAKGPVALVMGGGWGLGPIAEAAERLAERGVQVLAAGGRNRALGATLERLALRQPAVRPLGHAEDMATAMAAADVVVTTPGALSCAEARRMRRRLVLVDAVAGHGRENLEQELAAGGAVVAGPSGRSVAEVTARALSGPVRPLPPRRRQASRVDLASALGEVLRRREGKEPSPVAP
jgi:processive 1,2-diacylglycerol beta-glucosyltransferase